MLSMSFFSVEAKVLDLTVEEDIGFPPADLVTFIFVLSAIHPDKHDQAVQNLAKMLKPGGLVFVRDYGVLDYAMIRFGRDAKISDRFYARQDGTRYLVYSIK
jgi:methyltransferase-like protein 6